jgi:hypothetical protein
MKHRSLVLAVLCAAALGLSACLTLDDERFADVPCQDLKKLIAQDNLRALASAPDFKFRNLRDVDRKDKQIFANLSEEEQHSAELRAAYKNMCR